MPLLRKGVLLPVEGVDYSIPATFVNDRTGFVQNMSYYKGEMRKRVGKTRLGGQVADASRIMGLGKLELSTSKHLVRASKTKFERFNTSISAWVSIASTDFSGGDDDFFHFTTVTESGLLIITNYIDSIRKWTGSGNNAILGGSPPKAKFCTYLSPYLVLGYINSGATVNPWKIQWCDTDAPEVWSGGTSGSALASNDTSVIQNIVKLNEFIAVYKKESLWLARKVETSDIFLLDPIKTGIGLGAQRAVADAEGRHYFMGQNDFYVWNGIREESIGRAVRDNVFERINRGKIDRCFAVHVQHENEIWFFIIISGYDYPNEVWKYNYRLNFWYFDTCDSLTAGITWERVNSESWDDDPGPWDSAPDVWDSGTSVANWEDIVFGKSDGYTENVDYSTTNDNSVAVSSHIISKDFTGDQLEFLKRWLQLDVWGHGPGKMYVDYSTDEGSTWTNIPYTSSQAYIEFGSITTKVEMYFDIIADKIRFRFRNAESGENMYIRQFYPYYLSNEQIMVKR